MESTYTRAHSIRFAPNGNGDPSPAPNFNIASSAWRHARSEAGYRSDRSATIAWRRRLKEPALSYDLYPMDRRHPSIAAPLPPLQHLRDLWYVVRNFFLSILQASWGGVIPTNLE